jgi:hypothetical protein
MLLHHSCFLDSQNDNPATISPTPTVQVALAGDGGPSPETPIIEDEIQDPGFPIDNDSTLVPRLVSGPFDPSPGEGTQRFEAIAEESDGQSDPNTQCQDLHIKPESDRSERPYRQATARPRPTCKKESVDVPKEAYEVMMEIEDASATEADDESSVLHDNNEIEGSHLEYHSTTDDQSEPVECSFHTQDQEDSPQNLTSNEPENDLEVNAPPEIVITPEHETVGECDDVVIHDTMF